MREGVPGLCCAIALFIGTCAGLSLSPGDDAWVDAALMAAIALSMAAWLTRRRTTPSWWMVLLAVALLGVVTAGIGATGRPLEALQGLVDPEPTLVRFEARLLERFRPPDAARTDTLDAFQPDAESPPWNATAELVALHGEEGRRPVTGRVTISAPTGPHDLKPGDRVEGVGWLAGPSAPMNPGEGDMRRATWNAGWVGRLRVDSVPACREPAGPLDLLLDGVRRFADQSLVEALEGWCDGPTRALVVAMTTGRRLPGYAALR